MKPTTAHPTSLPASTPEPQPPTPRYTPEQMVYQASLSAGNLGSQSGVAPQIPPVFWSEHGKTIDPSILKRFN